MGLVFRLLASLAAHFCTYKIAECARKTWQIRHQKAPNCLIGYPNLSLSFSLL